jgi:hypothetical protein
MRDILYCVLFLVACYLLSYHFSKKEMKAEWEMLFQNRPQYSDSQLSAQPNNKKGDSEIMHHFIQQNLLESYQKIIQLDRKDGLYTHH